MIRLHLSSFLSPISSRLEMIHQAAKGYLRPRLATGQALLQNLPHYPLPAHLAQFHLVFPARVIEEDDPVARLQAEDVPYLVGQGAGDLHPFPLKPFWGDKKTV